MEQAPVDFSRYAELSSAFEDETVTHAVEEDYELPGHAGRFAVIRLDNGHPKRPTTLGPHSLIELGQALSGQAERARAGEIVGLGIIGKPGVFVAGADLSAASRLHETSQARLMAELGHQVYDVLEDFPVPTFAFINGTALGGGLELALATHYRTIAASAGPIGLPEVFLGIVPGWGGLHRLPRLIGPESAATVIFANPLANNRTLKGLQAYEAGIADAVFEDEFEANSLEFAAQVITGDAHTSAKISSRRAEFTSDDAGSAEAWDRAVARARQAVDRSTGQTSPGPLRALEVFQQVPGHSRTDGRDAECAALGELLVTEEFANTVYAFLDLTQRRAKNPAGRPNTEPITLSKIGVVGAGLMASQLAFLFAHKLQLPVVISDVDQDRVDKGLATVEDQAQKLLRKGRISTAEATALVDLVSGSTDKQIYAEADLVIEAVFEDISVKKEVFAELEKIVSRECVLATNTSSLSVAEMASELRHPERVVGFHFFNPVAVMPLIEIARTSQTSEMTLATAFDLAARLGKSPVLTKDSTAFVVNRVLLRLLSEVLRAFDQGTDPATVNSATDPIGLPMRPFRLLAMVGLPVAQHVMTSLHSSFGARFHVSDNIQQLIDHGAGEIWSEQAQDFAFDEPLRNQLMFGNSPQSGEDILRRVQDALAEEISLILDEDVVASAEDIDLCMILGAGWPLHRGGITPYLDQCGASQRVLGRSFHAS